MVTQVKSSNIATGSITSDQIATGAITVADIPDGEITSTKLHTTLDLSSKTITLNSPTITGDTAFDTNTLFVDATNDRVGIGTNSPSYPLDISSSVDPVIRVNCSGTGPNTGLSITKEQGSGDLANWNAITINGNDNVSYESRIQWIFDSIADGPVIGGKRTGGGETQLAFHTNSGETLYERMRVDSSGNVLVGTTVNRASTATPRMIINTGSSSATTIKTIPCGLAITNTFNGDATNYGTSIKMHFSGNNEVGKYAAISSYASRTFANGTGLRFWTNPTGENGADNTTQRMQIDHSGSIGAGGSSTNIYNASDSRLKKDVQPLLNATNIINSLNPVSFKWIDGFTPDEQNKTLYGFVAQEVQQVDTNLIESFGNNSVFLEQENSEDLLEIENPLRVNEKFIIPLLTAALQEAITKIEDLETRIQTLEGN